MAERREGHPNRQVEKARFEQPAPSMAVERWTDPSTWSEERLEEWADSEPVREREAWLKTHNSLF